MTGPVSNESYFCDEKNFGLIAENNDGYDEISEKKIKNPKKFNFDSRNISDINLLDFSAQYLPPFRSR